MLLWPGDSVRDGVGAPHRLPAQLRNGCHMYDIYNIFCWLPFARLYCCVCALLCSRPGELRGGDEKPFAVPPGLRLSTARDRFATHAACARNYQKKGFS